MQQPRAMRGGVMLRHGTMRYVGPENKRSNNSTCAGHAYDTVLSYLAKWYQLAKAHAGLLRVRSPLP